MHSKEGYFSNTKVRITRHVVAPTWEEARKLGNDIARENFDCLGFQDSVEEICEVYL